MKRLQRIDNLLEFLTANGDDKVILCRDGDRCGLCISEKPYKQVEDCCVFCEQRISIEVAALMNRLVEKLVGSGKFLS
jgi:hypothetical protein